MGLRIVSSVEDQSALSESVVLCPVPNTLPLAIGFACSLSGSAIGQIGPESAIRKEFCLEEEALMGTDPLRKLTERGSKLGRCGPGNHQDARKSRRINAESRRNPSPTVNGIAPNEAAIQASGSTRAMSVKVIM